MYYIGIDLGGTNIAIGIVDEEGRILHKDSVPTMKEREWEAIVADLIALTEKVIMDSKIDMEKIKSIGMGCPGITDNDKGMIVYAANLPFRNSPVREMFAKKIPLPLYFDNDANVAGLAESMIGAARGTKHSITVTLGTGVGGGVVVDGKVYSGFNGGASELGHMVVRIDGHQCGCGRKGCLEAYASATALIRLSRAAAEANPSSIMNRLVDGDLTKINGKTAFDAKSQGDHVGAAVVEEYIMYLAEGLANLINIFQPEVIVIGGGVSKQGEVLLKPLREAVYRRAFGTGIIPQTSIVAAKMGNDAGIVGAAMLGKMYE